MEKTLERTTLGLGYATQADAFQCGREAAQQAKAQVQEGPLSLVLVFGPNDPRFKDYVEGVRLVTGEETLIGIPTPYVLSTDLPSTDSCLVLILQSPSQNFSIASTEMDSNHPLIGVTSLFTELRQTRGNIRYQFDHHGLLVFGSPTVGQIPGLAESVAADTGLESWIVGAMPRLQKHSPLVSRNRILSHGAVAIECLSNAPWGIGSVSVGSFMGQPDVFGQAVKSAFRDAMSQMDHTPPAFGFLFHDLTNNQISKADLLKLLSSAQSIASNTPLIALPTSHQFIKPTSHAVAMEKDALVAVLVPQ